MAPAAQQRWAVAAGAVVAILCARPAITAACSPAFGIYGREVLPPDGAVDVPLNAEITVVYEGDVDPLYYPVVRPVRGEVLDVAIEATDSGWRLAVVLSPAGALAPDTTYEVLDRLEMPCEDLVENCIRPDFRVITTFTTGRQVDDSAPAFGGLEGIDSGFQPEVDNDSCGVYSYVYFTLDWGVAKDDGPQQWVRYQIYDAQDRLRFARSPSTGAYGQALCTGQADFWPLGANFAGPIGGYYVHAVDLAGNEDDNRVVLQTIGCGAPTIDAGAWPDASSPPDASSGAAGDGGGCGCSVEDQHAGTPLEFLLAWVALSVRRRSARSR